MAFERMLNLARIDTFVIVHQKGRVRVVPLLGRVVHPKEREVTEIH